MKKAILNTFLSFLLAASFTAPCQASSQILINRCETSEVLQFATGLYLMANPQYALESSSEDNAFLTTAKQGEGADAFEEKLNFNVTQEDSDVKLEIHAAKLRRDAEGRMQFEQISRPGPERFYLALIKSMFNNYYRFGYTLGITYKEGGFVIEEVEKDSAMALAGVKEGDILTAVNKVAIKPEDEALYNDVSLPTSFTGKPTEFSILRKGEKLSFMVKPKPMKAALKNRKEE